jgi:hypothetical protein
VGNARKPGNGGVVLPDSPGRPLGVPNKATTAAREAIALFVEANIDRLNGWLDAIAKDDPTTAFKCFMSVVEYHIPKLARQEIRGDHQFTLVVTTGVNAPVTLTGPAAPGLLPVLEGSPLAQVKSIPDQSDDDAG